MNHMFMKKSKFPSRSNYVAHRDVGDIPGCVPAVDVFIDRTQEEVRELLSKHTDKYIALVRDNIAGKIGDKEFKNHSFFKAGNGVEIFRNKSNSNNLFI